MSGALVSSPPTSPPSLGMGSFPKPKSCLTRSPMTLHEQQECFSSLSLTFCWAEEREEEIILLQSRAQVSITTPAVVKEPGEGDRKGT